MIWFLALVLASTAAASTRVAQVDRATMLSAYGHSLVYSKRDPSSDRYRLMYVRAGRRPVALPVADRAVPFDADLGPGHYHELVAVYSRCEHEPGFDPLNEHGPPDYVGGRGCDLYKYDFATGRERRLHVSSPRFSETTPTIWGSTVAYAARRGLYARTGLEPPRKLQSGPRGGAPTGLDLRGDSLAFGWTYTAKIDALGPASDMRIHDVVTGKLRRRVDTFPGGGLTTIGLTAPSFEGPRLYWARLCQGDPAGCAGRTGLMRTGPERDRIFTVDLWQARGTGVTYVLHDSDQWGTCHVSGEPTCTIVARTTRYRPWAIPPQ